MRPRTQMLRATALAALLSLLTFGVNADAAWSYRYFKLPNAPNQSIAPHKKQIESWLNGLGPKPDGIRFIPATNGMHFWVRHDKKGHSYRLTNWGKNKWTNPMGIRNGLYYNALVFGGFLRRKGKNLIAMQGSSDDQWAFGLTRTGPNLDPRTGWVYKHQGTKAKDWKKQLESFINVRKPNHGSDIVGGLSRGRDFHVWIRKSNSSCKWKLVHEPMPRNSAGLLNGRIRLGIIDGSIAPLGFNYQSPQHLWYAKVVSKSCLRK